MRRPQWLTTLVLVCSVLLVPGAAHAASADAPTAVRAAGATTTVDPDPSDRESMRQGYLQILKPAMEVPIGWTGNLSTCDAGAPSAAAQQATLTAVNYFRDLEGEGPVVFDSTLSARAQQAALMMAANQQLSHDPPSSWTCYTPEGHEAAAHSDLYLGITGAAAVAGYMVDPGSSNTFAGHRRWIIDPRQTTMGSGSVGSSWEDFANALYVVDSHSWQAPPAGTPAYLPWPVAGYVPMQIEPQGRWSLSASDTSTDFSQATVKVNGTATGITVHPVTNGYGPPTLVWNFDPTFKPGDPDKSYHVVVSDIVVGGVHSSYAYDVTLFDADPPQLEPQTITFAKPADRDYGAAAKTLQATASSGLPVTFTSQTPAVCSTSGTRGQTVAVVSAGTCTIAANQAGDDTYAAAPQVTRSFTIAKKELTVSAVDSARRPGEPNPAFDVAWSGFAYGETLATSDVTGAPSCSTTATAGSPEGSYPISCSAGTLASADYSFAFEPGTLQVDGTAPTVAAVGDDFVVALGAFTTDWTARDPSGVDGIQERETTRTVDTGFGPWASDPSDWGAGSTDWPGLEPGGTTCLSARARDTVGNVSGWTAPTCVHTPLDSSSLKAPRAWHPVDGDGFWQGSVLTAKKKGATLKVPGAVDVDRVGIVASRCRGCGKVGVYVGSTKVGELSLNGQKVKNRVVMLLPQLASPLDGPVKVVVESTRKKVQVDGVVVSGTPSG